MKRGFVNLRLVLDINLLLILFCTLSIFGFEEGGSLWVRGYAVIPEPQIIELKDGDFRFGSDWGLELVSGVTAEDIAVRTLLRKLKERFGIELRIRKSGDTGVGKIIQLDIIPGSTAKGKSEGIVKQAYILDLNPDKIIIHGNDRAGLFYGIQTFIQLLSSKKSDSLTLPICRIEDWPEFELREIHWDTKHHQDRLETLKGYLDRLAEYKINAVGWEIEDKFAYQRHPVIGAPGAFTKEQIQELVQYAKERYIEIIPLIQGPSHMAFVLKHPEHANLREDIKNNYMICPSKEESWRLIFDMYDEILEATEGGKYFHVATDEAYFLGSGKDCRCAEKAKQVGRSGLFVDFMKKTSEYLHEWGREVMFWGESPLNIHDIPKLPNTLIDAVAGSNEEEIRIEKEHGMRIIIYVSSQGTRPFFPEYLPQDYPEAPSKGRLASLYNEISFGAARKGLVLGTFIAAWDDSGLHNEVFWLGWVAGSAYGWHPGLPEPEELTAKFMGLFYGPEANNMLEVYRLMDNGAQFWRTTWGRIPSTKKPIYGSSRGKFKIPRPRMVQSIDLPNLPDSNTLYNHSYWKDHYRGIMENLDKEREANNRLIGLLNDNLKGVSRNKYNVEVMLSIAKYFRHNINLFETLAQIEDTLSVASRNYLDYQQAMTSLNGAEKLVEDICKEREQSYQELVRIWEISRYPKGQTVGGKKFVHIMDDTKDHFADRTPDLSYLVMRERGLNLEKWAEDLRKIREEYSKNIKSIRKRLGLTDLD